MSTDFENLNGLPSDQQRQLRDSIMDTDVNQKKISIKMCHWAADGEFDAINFFLPDERVKLDVYVSHLRGSYPSHMSVFHVAAKYGRVDIAKALLEQERLNPHLCDGDDGGVAGAALHIAVGHQQYAMIDFLLRHPRIDVNYLNGNGESALQIAVDVHLEKGGMRMIDQFLRCPRVDASARPQGNFYKARNLPAQYMSRGEISRDSFNSGAIHRVIKSFRPGSDENAHRDRMLRKLLGHHAAQITRERILFEHALRANLITIDSDILQNILTEHFQDGQQRIVDPANVDYMVEYRYVPDLEEPPYKNQIELLKRFVEKYGNLDDYNWEPKWLK